MNPRVSPSTKNVALLTGKNGVCLTLNGGIPSHFRDEKVAVANYDLSHLDVVPSTLKASSPKTGHVHFVPEKIQDSPVATGTTRIQNGKSHGCLDYGLSQADGCGVGAGCVFASTAVNQDNSSSESGKGDDQSMAVDAFTATPTRRKCPAAGRSNSFNAQSSPSVVSVQRSHSMSKEDTRSFQPADRDIQILSSGEKGQGALIQRDQRSLSSTSAATPCLVVGHKPPAGTRKDYNLGLSVHFADSVASSPKSRDKYSSVKSFESNSPLLRKDLKMSPLYCDTSQKLYINTSKQTSNLERDDKRSDIIGSHASSSLYPSKNTFSLHYAHGDSPEDFRHKRYKDTQTSTSNGEYRHHTPTKHPALSTSNGNNQPPGSNIAGAHQYFDQSRMDVKPGAPHLSALGISTSSTSLKLLDQLKHDPHHNGASGASSLTPSSSMSSSSSLSKETTPPNLHDFSTPSPTSLSKLPRHGLNSDDLPLTPLSSAPSSSSSSATPSRYNPRRSSACLRSDCVFGNRLDYIATSNLTEKDNLAQHPASPSSLGRHINTALSSYLAPASSLSLAKKYDLDSLPFSDLKHLDDSLASLIKKESIAASYQLEYCWFCGRPMPPFGTR